MADVYNKSFSLLDDDGNRQILTITGVEADVDALESRVDNLESKVETDVDALESRVDNLESGSIQFAEKDYSQVVNQGEMVTGVTYFVAFNSSGTFVQADSSDVVYFDKYKKDSSGTVKLIGRQYTSANLQNVAYTNKSNTFTSSQLMNSSEKAWNSINANKLVTKSEVALKTTAIETSITNITNGTTQIPVRDATQTQKGVVQLASQVEVNAGTNTTKAVTPANLQTKINAVLSGSDDGDGSNTIAYTNKANTFTPSQTFTGGATITSKPSWSAVGANNLVSKTEVGYELTRVGNLINAVEQDITEILNGTQQVTIKDATTSQKGVVQLASQAEVNTGTNAVKAVTPATLQAKINTVLSGGSASAIAYTNKANTFTPSQTFTGGATITSKRDWASVGANNLVSKTEVGYELTRIGGLIDAVEEDITQILNGTQQVTIKDATTSQKGVVQLATTTEVVAGTNVTKAVTAAGVQAAREAMFKGVESMPEASGMQKGVLYFSKS